MRGLIVIVAILLAAFLAYAATRPGHFHIQRTRTIRAPREQIFALIDDFSQWPAWSPYERLDPHMNRTRSGPPSGIGSVYQWDGNRQAGAGRMEIVAAEPPSSVTIQLDMIRPMQGQNIARFTLASHGDSTGVTWSLDGPQPYLVKVITIFLNMDALLGKEFDTGLANLQSIAERAAAPTRSSAL